MRDSHLRIERQKIVFKLLLFVPNPLSYSKRQQFKAGKRNKRKLIASERFLKRRHVNQTHCFLKIFCINLHTRTLKRVMLMSLVSSCDDIFLLLNIL